MALDAVARIEERRVIFTELLHEHRLAHAAVAIDREQKACACPRNAAKRLHGDERGLGAGIDAPIGAMEFPNPTSSDRFANSSAVTAVRWQTDCSRFTRPLDRRDPCCANRRREASRDVVRQLYFRAARRLAALVRACADCVLNQFALRDRGLNNGRGKSTSRRPLAARARAADWASWSEIAGRVTSA